MRRTTLAVSLLALVACGDDSTKLDTGVPPNRPLSEVTPSEAGKICNAISDRLTEIMNPRRLEQMICTAQGVAWENAKLGKCETRRDECLASGEVETGGFAPEGICEGFEEAEGVGIGRCTGDVTVGDFEDCFGRLTNRAERVIDQVTCANLGGDLDKSEDLLEDFFEIFSESDLDDLPVSCRKLSASCEDFDFTGDR